MPPTTAANLLAHFTAQLHACKLRPENSRIAVAVSGGSDSQALALLSSWWALGTGASTDDSTDASSPSKPQQRTCNPGAKAIVVAKSLIAARQVSIAESELLRLPSSGVPIPQANPALFAFIVDHQLRPESSAEVIATARRMETLGLKPVVLKAQWGGGHPPHGALMAAARRERLRLFRNAGYSLGVSTVLVGHQADDQTETFLLRCSRGSGLDGMAGMVVRSLLQLDSNSVQPGRDVDSKAGVEFQSRMQPGRASLQRDSGSRYDSQASGLDASADSGKAAATSAHTSLTDDKLPAAAHQVSIVRPLLEVSRAALRQLLLEEDLPWIDDPTNADRSYSRNAIRYMISLAQETPPIAADLQRLQQRCSAVHARLQQSVEELLSDCLHSHGQAMPGHNRQHAINNRCSKTEAVLDTSPFASVSDPVASRALAAILQAVSGKPVPPKLSCVHRLVQQLKDGRLRRGFSGGGCVVAPVSGSRGTKAIFISQTECSQHKKV